MQHCVLQHKCQFTLFSCEWKAAVHLILQCMDLDPEYLPRRLLTDFSIYNAEVRRAVLISLGRRSCALLTAAERGSTRACAAR